MLITLFFAFNVVSAGTAITVDGSPFCCGCCCTMPANMDMASNGLAPNNADDGCSNQETPLCHVKSCDVKDLPFSEITLTKVSFEDEGSQALQTMEDVPVSDPGHAFGPGIRTDHQRPFVPIYLTTCTFLC